MVDKQRYFDGNRVKREIIVQDIRYRRLSHDDLLLVISDPEISAAFYGKFFEDKIPKNQWDEEYLEKLSYAVVSESFNKDYLLYLEEVAGSVSAQKNNSKIVIGGIVLTAAVIAVVVVTVSII